MFKWYEQYNVVTKKRYWWTQRYGKDGICYEIRENNNIVSLYRCDIFVAKFKTLQEAMNEAEKELKQLKEAA